MKKKLFSLLLIAVMVLSSFSAVFADEYTITINKNDGQGAHKYEAYQIFDATYEANKEEMKNVKWGANVNGEALVAALKEMDATAFEGLTYENSNAGAAAVAKAIQEYTGTDYDSAKAQRLAVAIASAVTGTPTATTDSVTVNKTGYYFIKDVTNGDLAQEDTMSRYILCNVKGSEKITIKSDVIKSEKKVKDKDDNTGIESDWQDAADYDIGDKIPFKLSATLPDNFGDFKHFKLYFVDKQSAGLTLQDSTDYPIVVKITSKDGETVNTLTRDTDYTVVKATDTGANLESGVTFEVRIPELVEKEAAEAGAVVTVEYFSELNNSAVYTVEGNPNTSFIKYSRNPYNDGTGEPDGTTPEDKVTVFTFKIVANKVGDEGEDLDGAKFQLYKKVNDEYVACGEELTSGHVFNFTGKDAGFYKLVETEAPKGYNKAADIEFEIRAEWDKTSAEPVLKGLKVFVDGKEQTGEEGAAIMRATLATSQIDTTVVNRTGSTLPETGGMGTTIIYILGAALVIGAGVVLVSRKKVDNR